MPTLQAVFIGAILSIFVGLGLALFVQHERLVSAEGRYAVLLKQSAVFEAENDNWKNLAEQQDKKLVTFLAAQAARNAAAAKAILTAKQKADRYIALAAAVKAQKATLNDCADAQRAKDFYLKNRR